MPPDSPLRLAIVAGHPVQYISPWLSRLARHPDLSLKVFYLWDLGVSAAADPGFGRAVQWDIPMLEGYEHQFSRNRASQPGNENFFGYINPDLPQQLAAWEPDAILLMNYAFFTYIALLLDPRFWRLPFLFRGDSHNLGRRADLRSRISAALRALIFSRFAAFLVAGDANRAYYRSSGVPASKLFMGRHAVDNTRFRLASETATGQARTLRHVLGINDETVILFVGKFVPVKRPLDLLEAFALLPPERRSGARLVYVGDGPLRQTLVARAAELGLSGVEILPFQNQSRMPTIYSLGDLLVLPSQSETWGLVVNEAMNLDCPAVVSDHVGCGHDLVLHGETGWVFPTGDVRALARCLQEALEDPERLRRIGRQAGVHVARFSYDGITDSLVQALRFSLRRRPAAG